MLYLIVTYLFISHIAHAYLREYETPKWFTVYRSLIYSVILTYIAAFDEQNIIVGKQQAKICLKFKPNRRMTRV